MSDKEVRSPFLTHAEIEKDRVILTFSHAEEGLICTGKVVKGLQIAGEDGVFVEAKANIKRKPFDSVCTRYQTTGYRSLLF